MDEFVKRKNEKEEINKLKAEITLVRNNLKKAEKENFELKQEISKNIILKNKMEEDFKKTMGLKLKENIILENQRKYFKSSSKINDNNNISNKINENNTNSNSKINENMEDGVNSKKKEFFNVNKYESYTNNINNNIANYNINIPNSYILNQILSKKDLDSDKNIEKMKFFKNYYFDDFYNLEFNNLNEILENFIKQKNKQSIVLFSIFCFKKTVFTRFCNLIFEDSTYLDLKIEIITNVPSDWVIECINTTLSKFIEKHKNLLGILFINVSESCFSLCKIFDRSDFDRMINFMLFDKRISYQIIKNICKNKIDGYIDGKNIHLIPVELLKILFGDKYFE